MGRKREALRQLRRAELVEAVDRLGLDVADRRVVGQVVDVLVASRRATLAEVLAALSRDRLKEICRALGLDDSGREKAALVARLAGGEPAAPRAEPTESPPPVAKGFAHRSRHVPLAEPETPTVPAQGETLTVERLERALWSAADILRGSIDSSDYKNYIFGLLFLKRLSDRFEEERTAIAAAGDDPGDRDNYHEFFVPDGSRWSEIRKHATGLGEVLNEAS